MRRSYRESDCLQAAVAYFNRIGCETKFFTHAARARASLRADCSLSRFFQNSSMRRLEWMQRRASTLPAPDSDQNMPDCLQRAPMTVLQPASTTPEPMK